MRIARRVVLSDSDLQTLQRWARGRRVAARLVMRARIVLMAAAGRMNKDIASELGIGTKTVCLWRRRFTELGIVGIEKDAPRGGRPATGRAELVATIIRTTLTESPPGARRWSTRTLATVLGTSPAMVQRVWKEHRLQPHRAKIAHNAEKTRSGEQNCHVVGWLARQPDFAIALGLAAADEFSARPDSQATLRVHSAHSSSPHTFIYSRAIHERAPDNDIREPQEPHDRLLAFLKDVDAAVSSESDIHLIVDDSPTLSHPSVRRWLSRHPRINVHMTSSGTAWLMLAGRALSSAEGNPTQATAADSVRDLLDTFDAHRPELRTTFGNASFRNSSSA